MEASHSVSEAAGLAECAEAPMGADSCGDGPARASSSVHVDVGAAADQSAESASEKEPAAKRPRREAELPCTADGSSASAFLAAPIPHPLVSPPVDLAALGEMTTAMQRAVQLLITERAELSAKLAAAVARAAAAEAGRAAAAEMNALHEQARALEATHPAVATLVQTHSQLWHAMSDNGSSLQGQHWPQCLLGCPVRPQGRCMELLSLLAQLQQADNPPSYRIFHLLDKPLFDCLEGVPALDQEAMLQIADYLQLPKALVARLQQHAAAEELRLTRTSPASLPAALQKGSLRLLLDASLAGIPNLFASFEDRKMFPEVDPDFDDEPEADEEELDLYDFVSSGPSSKEQQRCLLADPCFLQGLCNAPCAWVPGCKGNEFEAIHLAGLVLVGHPLPSKLPRLTSIPMAAAAAAGNFGVWLKAGVTEKWMCAAARFGRIEMLAWALARPHSIYDLEAVLLNASKSAAAAGQFAALRFLLQYGCEADEGVAAAAARCGDLPMLQFLRAGGCPWDSSALAQAAAGGHKKLLKWAIANGCPRDARACAGAASAGKLSLVRWLREQGFVWDVRCYVAAAEGRHMDIMRYLRENGCDWGAGNAVCAAAARAGSREMLQWCRENGAAWGPRTCEGAAAGGHLENVRYAHERGCPMNERTPCAAARHGHAACLAWIFEHDDGGFTNPWIASLAARFSHSGCVKVAVTAERATFFDTGDSVDWWAGGNGDRDLVQWMMEWAAGKGDDINSRVAGVVCSGAANRGQHHVLEWMLMAGHLDLRSSAPAVAAFHLEGSPGTLQWLYAHGVLFDASVFETAAAYGDIKVLRWLRDVVNCPWDSQACVAAAHQEDGDSLEALQWLVQAGCPLSSDVWAAADDLNTRKWLCTLPVRPWEDKLVLWALREGDEEAAEWALAHEPDAAEAVKARGCAAAIVSGTRGMVVWARAHGGKWSDACAQLLASASDEMVAFCKIHGYVVGEASFSPAAAVGDAA